MERGEVNGFLEVCGGLLNAGAGEYSARDLAYLGDAVFELLTRSRLLRDGGGRVDGLTNEAIKCVNAAAQSAMYDKLLPHLTEDETAALKRGRNAFSKSHPKNASVAEYRRATGVEALFGYLYVTGRAGRITELYGICAD